MNEFEDVVFDEVAARLEREGGVYPRKKNPRGERSGKHQDDQGAAGTSLHDRPAAETQRAAARIQMPHMREPVRLRKEAD